MAIVLADGIWSNQSIAVAAAKNCHHCGIEVAGVGFGAADETFLRDISSGDVQAMLVDQSELTQSFGKIAQEIGGGQVGKRGRASAEMSVTTWRATDE